MVGGGAVCQDGVRIPGLPLRSFLTPTLMGPPGLSHDPGRFCLLGLLEQMTTNLVA